MDKPTVTFTVNNQYITFYVKLFDTKQSSQYKITKIRVMMANNSDQNHNAKIVVISPENKQSNKFITNLPSLYWGSFTVKIWCLVQYTMGDKQYDKISPPSTITVNLQSFVSLLSIN